MVNWRTIDRDYALHLSHNGALAGQIGTQVNTLYPAQLEQVISLEGVLYAARAGGLLCAAGVRKASISAQAAGGKQDKDVDAS